MKKIACLLITLIIQLTLGSFVNPIHAQNNYETDGEYNSSADYDDHDKAIFSNDPIFENYSFLEDRNSVDNPPDLQATNNGTSTGNAPIDGGITWVVGGLVGYGLSRIRKSKRNNHEFKS